MASQKRSQAPQGGDFASLRRYGRHHVSGVGDGRVIRRGWERAPRGRVERLGRPPAQQEGTGGWVHRWGWAGSQALFGLALVTQGRGGRSCSRVTVHHHDRMEMIAGGVRCSGPAGGRCHRLDGPRGGRRPGLGWKEKKLPGHPLAVASRWRAPPPPPHESSAGAVRDRRRGRPPTVFWGARDIQRGSPRDLCARQPCRGQYLPLPGPPKR